MTDSSKTQSDAQPAETGGAADVLLEPNKPRRATLRPPDWTTPNSVSSLALERLVQSRAIPRRAGNRAEMASLRARLKEARKQHDIESEKNLSHALAEKLVERGTHFAEATKLARRSLLLGEDPKLREDLSNWFAGLGEVSLAAGTLEPLLERMLDDTSRAATWTRIAVLRGRGGDAQGAARALLSAAEADKADPVPLELFAALRALPGAGISGVRAARALHEAAQRRKARNDERGTLADLLQAFEAEPGHVATTEQLADALFQSGRFQAADEVWRLAAERYTDSKPLHLRRLRDALGSSDVALALGAALDAASDTRLELDDIRTAVTLVNDGAGTVPVPNFDGLLAPAGLLLLLAARLEVAALQRGDHKALLALARLTAGPVGNPRQAANHLVDALVHKPDSDEAIAALNEYAASTGDYAAVLDAEVRIAHADDIDEAVLKARLADLALTAAQHLRESDCAAWALSRLKALGPLSPELAELEQRLPAKEAPPRFESWSQLSLAELRRALDTLADRPPFAEAYVEALLEMRRRDPSGSRWRAALERALLRQGATERLENFWQAELLEGRDQAAARLGLCRLFLAQRRAQEALQLLRDAALSPVSAEEAALLSVVASLYGSAEDRALGLQKLAEHARAPVRAVLLSVASNVLLGANSAARALRLAEEACHAAPSAARPIVCYAQAATGQHTRVAALAFQRACEVCVPRIEWCRALLEAQDDPKQLELALRRWLTLAPLELEPSQRLLAHLVQVGDAEQLAKTLDWLLGQPVPLASLQEELGQALRCVLLKNPLAAKNLAQRMLGVFGAKDEQLSALIGEVAERLGEPWLRAALLERGLAAQRVDPRQSYLELAHVREELGHSDLVFDALWLALKAGADVAEVRAWLPRVKEPTTSDGILLQLACWAAVLEDQEAADAAHAYREYGAALWDLAGDAEAAVEAWQKAAELDKEHGDERLAKDLIAFCGYEAALPELFQLSEQRPPLRAASLLLAAAALALADGFRTEAIELAVKGLKLDPTRTDALAIIERGVPAEDAKILRSAYATVEASLLGIYGARALHYRAARQFERRRDHQLAFQHAVLAFEAVPAEGVAFALMLRLAPLVEQQPEAARAIERVAHAEVHPARRALWLEHAARAAGPGPEGTRLRVDVLMRALLVRPEAESLEALGSALAELFREVPEERLKLQSRFDSSVRTLLRRLDDPEMVDVALTAAAVSADVFDSAGLTAGALRRALQLKPQSSAFGNVGRFSKVLGAKPGSTRPFLDELAEACTKQPLPALPLIELGVTLAQRIAHDLLPQFVMSAAKAAPDDGALVARAEALAYEHPHLLDELRGIVDLSDRVSGLFERVRQLEKTDPEHASRLLDDLLKQPDLAPDVFARALEQLERLHTERHQFDALEKLLARVIELEHLGGEIRSGAARRVALLLANRGAHTAALDVFMLVDRVAGMSLSDLEQAAQLARDGGDTKRELELCARLLSLRPEGKERLPELRRLLELCVALGQTPRANEWARLILELDEFDRAANEVLLKDAERREDWNAYVELWQRSIGSSDKVSERDVAQLADVQRLKLQQPRKAAETLAQFAAVLPGSVLLLERLAECWLQLEDLAQAGRAYAEARRVARDPRQVARFTELAAQNFVAAGELEPAKALLFEPTVAKTPALLQLRVEIAERQGDRVAHALALEELAGTTLASPAERAEYLRRAAEFALEGGDAELALTRAQRAARIAPAEPRAQVFARLLEYKKRGVGTVQEALTTITELRSLGRVEDPRLAELRAFLLAEALAKRVGSAAAVKELRDAERLVQGSPLLGLGLAEYLQGTATAEEVLGYYKQALNKAVEVVRPLREIALSAAAYAEKHGALAPAIEFLSPHEGTPQVAEVLLRLRANPAARTRFDLPQPKPSSGPSPDFFASIPPSVESTTASLSEQLGYKSASPPISTLSGKPSSAPKFRGVVSAPPVKAAAQLAPTPAHGTPRFGAPKDIVAAQPVPQEPAAIQPATVTPAATAPPAAASSAAVQSAPAQSVAPGPRLTATPMLAVQQKGAPATASPVTPPAASPAAPASKLSSRSGATALSYGRPPPKPGSQPQHAVPSPPAPLGAPPPAPLGAAPPPMPLGAAPPAPLGAAPPPMPLGAAPPAPLGAAPPPARWGASPSPEFAAPPAAAPVQDGRPPTPRLGPPPKKTATQLSGEFTAVRPRLDQTVELPVMTSTKERPVQVALKVDPRTFGKTWSSDQMAEAAGVMPESIAAAVQRASRPSLSFPAASTSEQGLLEALHGGNAEAGIQLSRLLQAQPARSHDQVAVGRSLVALLPGQAEAIELLLDAATRDRDLTYASALRHALSLFGNKSSDAPVAPPLAHQDEQPETLTKLLLGAAPVPALEALGLLVKHVPQLFRQFEPLDDTQRINADGLTPLSQLVGALHRLLGTQKTQVLARPLAEVASFRLLVGDPATLLVEGQGNPLTAEYRYYFGATLFASRPETLLALALPAERVSTIFDAILAAFGPPRQLQGDVPRVAQLAERLWESLPPRAQRRLQELAEQPELMHGRHALQAAQASWVKAGLFAAGDLHVAARDACRLAGVDASLLADPARVAEFARQNETFAELFRFATSLEYAVLRWSQPRSRSSVQGAVER